MARFENVSCSNCGASFGPGDHGFSHCDQHPGYRRDQKLCAHEWRVKPDSQFSNERVEDVVCTKCQCSGERDIATAEFHWPAT